MIATQTKNNTTLPIQSLLKSWCCVFLVLSLFACSSRDKPAPVVTVYGSIPLTKQAQNTINSSDYVVQPGETLYSIAWRANSDVRQIAKLNNIPAPYNIFPNQKLILVANKQTKSVKASNSKQYSKSPTKSSNPKSNTVVKKSVASSKKQAYGKNINNKKIIENSVPKENFSQKIRRWQWPVKGKVIAYFSSKEKGNKGIDIAGRRGTQIKATASGKVVYSGSALRGYGKLVIIKHNDDYLSAYAHNDRIKVKEQQQVNAGDVIATMGDTDAERVMLHFEVRFRGKSVDPLKYLPKR
ncbi:peptidoglycan DD-metalloendopeptidase family protein [Colwellia sp. 20A7]|jgi:lipoprotein NlpD|uniref:peptidoglycan DD-metalloendopeptidase family protein n=1 Tax=Colwellia sp. 20A7 TaxID=2689569 RepID=UPI00135CA68A|nr:peptidoglycan DD-metalloendopeptidase family protein [Colwellia sp. 20A7]